MERKSNIKPLLELEKVQKATAFFTGEKAGNGARVTKQEAGQAVKDSLFEFADFVGKCRSGKATDDNGREYPAVNAGINEFAKEFYGAKSFEEVLNVLGVSTQLLNLAEIEDRLGAPRNAYSDTSFMNALKQHSTHSFANSAGDFKAYSFIIPEIIMDAMRVGYQGGGFHRNWIRSEESTGGRSNEVTLPYIIMGGDAPKKVAEGANAPIKKFKTGQKKIATFKVMTGIEMTYELMRYTRIPLLQPNLEFIGKQLALKADATLVEILINGDVAGGLESAPVVGVLNTANGFTAKDLEKVCVRIKRLGHLPNVIIANEDDMIDIKYLPEYKGFAGDTKLADLFNDDMLGVPPRVRIDAFKVPTNQIIILSSSTAAFKLTSSGILVQDADNIETQVNTTVLSDHLNFGILKRDARVILDKSVTIGASPFPAWMDIDGNTSGFGV